MPRRALFLFALLATLGLAGSSLPSRALAADPPTPSQAPELADQAREWDVDGLEPLLPHATTQAELDFWQGREDEKPGRLLPDDPPPVAPVRNCAEWEPCTGVLIRYPLGLPYNLLQDLDDDVTLHVVVSSSYLATAQSSLLNNGVDMSRVEFLVRANDSIWTRDYGPWFIFDGNGDIGIVNHTYNRPSRPNDNLIPLYFGQEQGIPVYSHSMYHTGGNYMTDGAHISCSTRLVYNEAATYNGMTQAQVDQLMLDYYGVQNYDVLDYIESGGIHHIDTWAKFLDEETVMVKQVWPSHGTYAPLEQRATLLASLQASTGRHYQVHRVYCYSTSSGPASYTNSLVLNDNIYVPFFGNSTYDQQALDAYREAEPGYTVRGYYYSGFLSDDALHCRAKGVMDGGMLRVAHVPIITDQPAGPVPLTVDVRAHSGMDVTLVRAYYRLGGGDWQSVDLVPTGTPDQYTGALPTAGASGDTCDYFIHAEDASGRHEGMPRVEPARWYSFWHAGTPTAVAGGTAPAAAVLHPNYPNPFNPSTVFSFDLKYADTVSLDVIDARGHRVRTLITGPCPAGHTEIAWYGDDDQGRAVASGTYYYRLRAAGLQYSRAATLIK